MAYSPGHPLAAPSSSVAREIMDYDATRPSLACLPTELHLTIAEFLDPDTKALSHLSRTCHYLHTICDPLLLGKLLLTAHLQPESYLATLETAFARGARANARETAEPVTWDLWHAQSGCTNGRTLLHIAVSTQNLRAVELVLEHGARPNARTESCCTEAPLHQAARNGSVEIMQRLIARGAEVDIHAGGTDVSPERFWGPGPTPLCLAVMNEGLDAAKLLVDNGADVNIHCTPWRCGRRAPVLHWAKSVDMVVMLLDNGANVNATDREEKSLLYRKIVDEGQTAGAVATGAAIIRVLTERGGKCVCEGRVVEG